jgi:Crinkler effector protein N-terminal domain
MQYPATVEQQEETQLCSNKSIWIRSTFISLPRILLWVVSSDYHCISTTLTISFSIGCPDTLKLFCVVQSEASDRNNIFSVELKVDKTVDDARNSIKGKQGPKVDNICAKELVLYQVSMPDTDGFWERVKSINLQGMKSILPMMLLPRVFPSVASGHIHVIIRVPSLLVSPLGRRTFTCWPNRHHPESKAAKGGDAEERRDETSELRNSACFFVCRLCHPS